MEAPSGAVAYEENAEENQQQLHKTPRRGLMYDNNLHSQPGEPKRARIGGDAINRDHYEEINVHAKYDNNTPELHNGELYSEIDLSDEPVSRDNRHGNQEGVYEDAEPVSVAAAYSSVSSPRTSNQNLSTTAANSGKPWNYLKPPSPKNDVYAIPDKKRKAKLEDQYEVTIVDNDVYE